MEKVELLVQSVVRWENTGKEGLHPQNDAVIS